MALSNSYVAGKFALQLDGVDVGFVMSMEGGEAFGEVVDEAPVGVRVGKHIAGFRYSPIVMESGASMDKPFYNWVASMLDGTQKAMNGAILLLDYDMKERSRLEWKSALITEVVLPGVDGAGKDAVRMRVTIQPESTHTVPGSGAKSSSGSKARPQKQLMSSHFRFTVSGLESACAKVTKVAPLVVRSTHALDVADVAFWLPEAEAAPFKLWFDDFVITGNNDQKYERNASLTYLDPSLKNELMRIDLEDVGICRVSHEPRQGTVEVVARVKVEMYCEAVRLAPVVAPEPTTPAPAPATAAVESLATALVAALQAVAVPGVATPEAITERLLGSIAAPPTVDDRERGRAAGRAWAAEQARLDELEALAELAERDDWTALALAEGHTLVVFLAAAGDLDAGETGPIDLRRDGFTSGLAAGAAEIYRSVAGRLGERRSPRS